MNRYAAFRILPIFPFLSLIIALVHTPCPSSSTEVTAADAAAQDAVAESFFGKSTLTGSTGYLREGETITLTLTIRYNGDEEPMPVTVVFPIPQPALLISASPAMSRPDDNREIQWKGTVGRDRDLALSITLITLPASADNRTLLSSVAIYWRGRHDGPNWQGGVHWLQTEAEIHSRPQTQFANKLEGQTVSNAEVVILAYFVGGTLLIFLIPRLINRRRQGGPGAATVPAATGKGEGYLLYLLTFVLVVLIGIAHLVVYFIMEDYRRLYGYRQSECTVLDKAITTHAMKSRPGQTQSRDSQIGESMVAVRYRLDDVEYVAAGPPEITSMRSPGDKSALRQLARFEIGRSYPCWIDPRDSTGFYLIPGISWGWYLLCAGPLILLFSLTRYLLGRLAGERVSPEN
ncbi:MAG: hypothetical protein F9K32_16390 [Desulfobulbaceae bacterium]|nr:MAG: hypothetical protein F9K32_16390 [Desulfobulbaceae bacterium]